MVRADVDERRSTQHSAQCVSSATLQTGESSSSFLDQEDTKQALQGENDASCVMDAGKGHVLRGDQEHDNLQQQEALLLQQAQHGTSIQKRENAIQLLLARQRMLRQNKMSHTKTKRIWHYFLANFVSCKAGIHPEAKQHYRDAFTLYQEERADYECMGARHEREIILKMMFCIRLLQNRCQNENDVQKVLKLSEIIESLEKESDALLSPSVTTEREVAQDNALSYDSASVLMLHDKRGNTGANAKDTNLKCEFSTDEWESQTVETVMTTDERQQERPGSTLRRKGLMGPNSFDTRTMAQSASEQNSESSYS
jgi:hypothetical protein